MRLFRGGVFVSINGTSTKHSGGIIYGSNAIDTTLKNTTGSDSYGYTVYITAANFMAGLIEYQYSLTEYWYSLKRFTESAIKPLSLDMGGLGSGLDHDRDPEVNPSAYLRRIAFDTNRISRGSPSIKALFIFEAGLCIKMPLPSHLVRIRGEFFPEPHGNQGLCRFTDRPVRATDIVRRPVNSCRPFFV